jgi:diacylglycerol kinase family enzyme
VRVTLIHNPGAGAQAGADGKLVVAMLREAGHKVRYQSAKEDGWKKALKKTADLIAIAGGDGTIAKVARRMAGRGVPLAALPLGTANNISRTLGLVDKPLEVLVDGWRHPRRVKLDVGLASGPWGERRFIEGVGAGLMAELLGAKRAKRRKGKVAHAERRIVHGLERLKKLARRCRPLQIEATLDGEDISGHYLLLEALSILHVGPSLYLAPESKPGDGTLDVVLVREAERARLLKYLDSWQENRERIAVLPSRRGRHLRMTWNGFGVHVDDKLRPKPGTKAKPVKHIDVRLDGVTVEFFCPPDKAHD